MARRFSHRRSGAALAIAVAAAVVLTAGCGGSASESADVPAFNADNLASTAGTNWPTVGGSFANDRYSTLDEIHDGDVGDLKGVWHTNLADSGTAAKYSGESQPVIYNGVLYVTTGANDVFAVDVASGKILWQYKANLDEKISTVCCGWLNRGVALGDGMVFEGQLDGKVVALDAKSGDTVWTRQLTSWEKGQTITAAPIYADGRIYLGVVWRRPRNALVPRGDGRKDREVRLAFLHDPRAGRARRRFVASGDGCLRARRRSRASRRSVRRAARTCPSSPRRRCTRRRVGASSSRQARREA